MGDLDADLTAVAGEVCGNTAHPWFGRRVENSSFDDFYILFTPLMAELQQAGRNKDNTIGALEEELRQLELLATEGKTEVATQTVIGAAYFNKKPEVGSSRGSGSLASQRTGAGRGSGERRVGGGGRVAGKPPPGDARKGSRIDDS